MTLTQSHGCFCLHLLLPPILRPKFMCTVRFNLALSYNFFLNTIFNSGGRGTEDLFIEIL